MPPPALVVTTSRDRGAALELRARDVAARCGALAVRRRGLEALFAEHAAAAIYIVGRSREEVAAPDGKRVFVHPGLFTSKLTEGRRHPFVRAVAGDDAITRIFDATVGLASDALHLAGATGAAVLGCEASAVGYSLLEEGLGRLARQRDKPWAEAAARVEVRHVSHLQALRELGDDDVDVVVFDPMFAHPARATPSFAVFRGFADERAVEEGAFLEARRVARRRVVLKLRRAWRSEPAELPWSRRIRSGSHDYLVHDVA